MLRRIAPPFAVGVAALVALTACADNADTANGPATATSTRATVSVPTTPSGPLPADQVVDAIEAFLRGSAAVHTTGSLEQDSVKETFDVQANRSGTTSGKVNVGGVDIPFIRANATTSVLLTKAVLERNGVEAVSAIESTLIQKYAPTYSHLVSDIADQVSAVDQYEELVNIPIGGTVKFTAAGSAQVNGALADGYQNVDGSVTFISREAPHRLLRLVGSPKGPGRLDYAWDDEVPVTAPAESEIVTS